MTSNRLSEQFAFFCFNGLRFRLFTFTIFVIFISTTFDQEAIMGTKKTGFGISCIPKITTLKIRTIYHPVTDNPFKQSCINNIYFFFTAALEPIDNTVIWKALSPFSPACFFLYEFVKIKR